MDICNNCSLGLKREDCSKGEYEECLKLAKAKSEYFLSDRSESSYVINNNIDKGKDENKKYHWYSYSISSGETAKRYGRTLFDDEVSEEHPFVIINRMIIDEKDNLIYTLMNYKEISGEEYELYNKLMLNS